MSITVASHKGVGSVGPFLRRPALLCGEMTKIWLTMRGCNQGECWENMILFLACATPHRAETLQRLCRIANKNDSALNFMVCVCETEREGWWGGGLCEKALSLSFSTWNVLLGFFNKLAIKLSVKCREKQHRSQIPSLHSH